MERLRLHVFTTYGKHKRLGISLFWHLSRHPNLWNKKCYDSSRFFFLHKIPMWCRFSPMQALLEDAQGILSLILHLTISGWGIDPTNEARAVRSPWMRWNAGTVLKKDLAKKYISSYLVTLIYFVIHAYLTGMLCCCLVLSRTYQRQQHLNRNNFDGRNCAPPEMHSEIGYLLPGAGFLLSTLECWWTLSLLNGTDAFGCTQHIQKVRSHQLLIYTVLYQIIQCPKVLKSSAFFFSLGLDIGMCV